MIAWNNVCLSLVSKASSSSVTFHVRSRPRPTLQTVDYLLLQLQRQYSKQNASLRISVHSTTLQYDKKRKLQLPDAPCKASRLTLFVCDLFTQALPLQALLKDTSAFVHESGGCVRRMDYHGLQGLPQRTRKDGKWHEQGDLWTMWFDVNPRTLANLREKMRTDPRVLR